MLTDKQYKELRLQTLQTGEATDKQALDVMLYRFSKCESFDELYNFAEEWVDEMKDLEAQRKNIDTGEE